MTGLQYNRQQKIREIISIVKLASLLLSAIIVFTLISNDDNDVVFSNTEYFSVFSLSLTFIILILIFSIWSFSSKRNYITKQDKIKRCIEDSIYILIFSVVIIISGGYTSQYKFLFLFIIITSTIQSGIKWGAVLATISSLIILAIDLSFISKTLVNKYFENDLILVGVFILTAWPLGYYVKIEREYGENLSHLVNIDGLTEVYNHRFFHASLKKEIEISKKSGRPVSIILLDINHFNYYNELNGCHCGDQLLKEIALLLKKNIRQQDILTRYKGDEFAIILPNTNEEGAAELSEKIRFDIENWKFKGKENQPEGKITVSIGTSTFPQHGKTHLELIESADDALNGVKLFDKNRLDSCCSILDKLKKDIEKANIDIITTAKTILSIIDSKDKYTYEHTERIVMYSELLGEKLGLTDEDKKVLKYGAYLHDIGKISISKGILIKKTPLTNAEWEIFKHHPISGVEIIKNVESLKDVIPLIRHHHERYDGTGYPNGLKANEIPYLARILAVVDSFDAMTSNRPYNSKLTCYDAILELKRCSGTQFDPIIVRAFIEIIEENKDKFDAI
ncbi:bifunctional diguanylate cyclase/phosphohydrolase [Fonticella tunisiensis]|uniref:Diguanylate cyclase (GGDEF)-like protein/putative nucleotidyltransferase with HDIG domain n=1 Tax=Fonticella tunisiensis TaxID=1096341 RepID=A0A4R7KSN3_9CLOT|nr:diguanylate cyclase [Fonticella tunisiensis]TDT62817.1 diguanylate cyclase (GGDEF)-like protein/putative nucleotidyltransferase with HDIG domain [Fonticella tunisiensis]